jgi:hypothetical protein
MGVPSRFPRGFLAVFREFRARWHVEGRCALLKMFLVGAMAIRVRHPGQTSRARHDRDRAPCRRRIAVRARR